LASVERREDARTDGQPRSLDQETLRRLRRFLADVQTQSPRGVSKASVARLAHDVQIDGTLTIDLDAAKELGQPLLILQPLHHSPLAAPIDRLSPRELEVTALVAQGLANKEIARRLGLSLATVKDHVHRILQKTGLPGRAAVASTFASTEYRPE
jgi:two-component system, NarL family, nitrate/nitrite response regulator NarL